MFELNADGEHFCFTAQIRAEDVAGIAAAGFRSIVCNRPDSEEGAVESSKIEAAAEVAGLRFVYMPVLFSTLGPQEGLEFGRLLDSLPEPTLAYCRTGRRCAALWAFARVGKLGLGKTLDIVRASGNDLEELRSRLSQSPAS